MVEHRVKVLNLLKEILQKFPRTAELVTRRPHTQDKTRKGLSERVTTRRTPSAGAVIGYFHSRLGKCATPDAIDSMSSLEANIMKEIHKDVSETWVETMALRKPPRVVHLQIRI